MTKYKHADGLHILVLGTSNAVLLDGYTSDLSKHPDVANVDVRSMGASSCISFAFFAEKIDFTAYDICIIEAFINDNCWIGMNKIQPETVLTCVKQIAAACLQHDCLPLHLMLPSGWIEEPHPPYVDIALKLHDEANLPFLDGFSLIKAMVEAGAVKSWFFRDDNWHVSQAFCADIADIVVVAVTRLQDLPRPERGVFSVARQIVFIPAEKAALAAESRVSHHSSALLSGSSVDLPIGETLEFVLPQGLLVGAVCNHATTNAAVEFAANETRLASFVSSNFGHPKPVFTTRPLAKALTMADGRLRVTALADDAAIVERFADFDAQRNEATPLEQRVVSLVGFVVETDAPLEAKQRFAAPVDLSQWIAMHRKNAWIEASRATLPDPTGAVAVNG